MPERIEKAYYFKKKEFFLLLCLGGLSEIYSFKMDAADDISHAEMAIMLHQLMKRGCIQMDEKVRLSEEMRTMIEKIRMAYYGLNLVPMDDRSQKICYLSENGVFVTELTGQNDEIRIRQMDWETFGTFLFEEMGMKEPFFETQAEWQEMEMMNLQMQREHQQYAGEDVLPLDTDLFSWMERREVLNAWEIQDLQSREPVRRILFRRGLLENWVMEQDIQGIDVYCDNRESRETMMQWLCRGKGEEER